MHEFNQMMFSREFNDSDIATTRRSIWTWVSLYIFFVFLGGFHLRPNGFFDTITGEPLTFSAPSVLWIIAAILAVLSARLFLLAKEMWYSKASFKLGGPGGASNMTSEFLKKIDDIQQSMEIAVQSTKQLSSGLEGLTDLDAATELPRELSEVMRELRQFAGRGDPLEVLERDLGDVLVNVRHFVLSKKEALNRLNAFGSDLGEFSRGLERWSKNPLRKELTDFLEIIRSDTMKANRSRKASFLVFETGLPLVAAIISILHSAWTFVAALA